MPLPASVNLITVTGTYLRTDSGGPASGTVTFTPPTNVFLKAVPEDVMLVPQAKQVTLDTSGAFSVELMVTDDPDVVPSFTYAVTENITGLRRTYNVEIPSALLPGPVDLSDIVPAGVAVTGTTALTTTTADLRYVKRDEAVLGSVTSNDITDATTVGKNVLKAATQADARTAIGAGTGSSNLALGTTSTTAKAGNYQPTAEDISNATTTGRNVLKAASQAAARTAIDAQQAGDYATNTALAGKADLVGGFVPDSQLNLDSGNITDFSEAVTSQVSGMGLVTATELTATTAGFKNIYVLSNPTDPDPPGFAVGDLLVVPTEAVIPLIWSFDPTLLADSTVITTTTASPNTYGQVLGSPTVIAASGSFRKGISVPNSTQVNVRMENQAPTSGDYALAFRMTLKAGVMPSASAWFLYCLSASGGHLRLALSATRAIEVRNASGSLLATGPVWPDNAELSFTVFGTVGTTGVSVRVRNMTASADIYSQDSLNPGTSSAIDDAIFARQSASPAYGADMIVHEQRYSPVAQNLNTSW